MNEKIEKFAKDNNYDLIAISKAGDFIDIKLKERPKDDKSNN